MIKYAKWTRPSGQSRISAQPVTCKALALAIRQLQDMAGSAFNSELKAHLIKQNVPEKSSRDTLLMLKYYNFAYETTEKAGKLKAQDWLNAVSDNPNERGELLVALATGIISGGYRPRGHEFSHDLEGTRLLLWGLRKVQEENPHRTTFSINELAELIDERGVTSIYCIVQLLGAPNERDPLSLAVIESRGSGREKSQLRLNSDALRNYQVAIVSGYLSKCVPKVIEQKYGTTFENALRRNLDTINAQSLRDELTKYPPVWLDERDRDESIRDVSNYWGYEWWAEDRAGGGVGLMGDQKYTYMKVKSPPTRLPLKSSFHGLF